MMILPVGTVLDDPRRRLLDLHFATEPNIFRQQVFQEMLLLGRARLASLAC